MKDWIIGAAFITLVMVGGFIVWMLEGAPLQPSNVPPPAFVAVNSYPAPVRQPVVAVPPMPAPTSNSPECPEWNLPFSMTSIAPGVSAALSGYNSAVTQATGTVATSMKVCLQWKDTVSSTQKTYTIFRGFGSYDLPIQSMTKLATVPESYGAFLDMPPNVMTCYALEISDAIGDVYNTPDACFSKP